MATGVYIDGLNLYYGALRNSSFKWLDLEKLAQALLPSDNIVLIRYFTARINIRDADSAVHSRQAVYLRALQSLPLVEITLGYVKARIKRLAIAETEMLRFDLFLPLMSRHEEFVLFWAAHIGERQSQLTTVRVVIDEEKGTDVNLASHLLSDIYYGRIDKALVISNDGDFREAIRLGRVHGAEIGIINPRSAPSNKHLAEVASFEIFLRPSTLAQCQLEQVVLDARKRQVHRPKEWR